MIIFLRRIQCQIKDGGSSGESLSYPVLSWLMDFDPKLAAASTMRKNICPYLP